MTPSSPDSDPTMTFHAVGQIPAGLRDFWLETLRAQNPAGVLAGSPEWFEAMAWGDEPRHGVAAVSAPDGRALAVIPLLRRPMPMDFRIGAVTLLRRPLDVMQVCGGDVIAAEGLSPSTLAAVWRRVLGRDPAIEGLWFGHVASAERVSLLVDSAREGGCFARVVERGLPHYRLRLPATLHECLSGRSTKSVQRLRSKERALERETGGACRVIEIRSRTDWEPYRERIEAMMNASWQAEVLGHRFTLDGFAGAAEHGWLRAFLLLCGETAVAFTLYFHGRGTMTSGVLGYDRRFARFSPGALLFMHTLEKLYEGDRPDWMDFGEGDADYKRQWANEQIEVSSVLLCRSTVKLRTLFLAQRGFKAGREASRRLLRAAGLERRLAQRVRREG